MVVKAMSAQLQDSSQTIQAIQLAIARIAQLVFIQITQKQAASSNTNG